MIEDEKQFRQEVEKLAFGVELDDAMQVKLRPFLSVSDAGGNIYEIYFDDTSYLKTRYEITVDRSWKIIKVTVRQINS